MVSTHCNLYCWAPVGGLVQTLEYATEQSQAQQEQINEKESEENRFNEVGQLLTSSGQKGREILLKPINSGYKFGTIPINI